MYGKNSCGVKCCRNDKFMSLSALSAIFLACQFYASLDALLFVAINPSYSLRQNSLWKFYNSAKGEEERDPSFDVCFSGFEE